MTLTFLGAAGEVTGSSFLIESDKLRFLVDCGMFQGGRDAERRNLEPFPFAPQSLDFVLLTHAHIDHSGLLPRLAAQGYRGPIFCTDATADLLSAMLPDSGHVQEQEAQSRNRIERRRGGDAPDVTPLYTVVEAQRTLRLLHGVAYDREISPHPDVRAVFRDSGHIIGSSIVELTLRSEEQDTRLVFSGDLGMPSAPVVRDPTAVAQADYLVVESTYGDRLHRSLDGTLAELSELLGETIGKRRGNVVFPAFAVGRTQSILCMLAKLVREERSPSLEIYIDSPLATAATETTLRHRDVLDDETRALLDWMRGAQRSFRVRFVQEPAESKALNAIAAGAVIISASGMCDAGRVKHHLRHNLPRSGSVVAITGFQAAGTLGRRLVDGAAEVSIHGESVPVRAAIHTIGGLSAHADQKALLGWLGHFRNEPKTTFVVHGEAAASEALASRIRETLHWAGVTLPARGQGFEL